MGKNIFLYISHMYSASYHLFQQSFLTVGLQEGLNNQFLLLVSLNLGYENGVEGLVTWKAKWDNVTILTLSRPATLFFFRVAEKTYTHVNTYTIYVGSLQWCKDAINCKICQYFVYHSETLPANYDTCFLNTLKLLNFLLLKRHF